MPTSHIMFMRSSSYKIDDARVVDVQIIEPDLSRDENDRYLISDSSFEQLLSHMYSTVEVFLKSGTSRQNYGIRKSSTLRHHKRSK